MGGVRLAKTLFKSFKWVLKTYHSFSSSVLLDISISFLVVILLAHTLHGRQGLFRLGQIFRDHKIVGIKKLDFLFFFSSFEW